MIPVSIGELDSSNPEEKKKRFNRKLMRSRTDEEVKFMIDKLEMLKQKSLNAKSNLVRRLSNAPKIDNNAFRRNSMMQLAQMSEAFTRRASMCNK